jgi:[acyl-carrier-protein] S-malonyltransferase
MGQDWAGLPAAGDAFQAADRALGYAISALCFDGPEEELKLTANQQPAILTVSYAAFQVIREELPPIAYFAGHSLGEYTALVAAGALGFEDAVATVHERGRLMQEAVPPGEGAMAAVLRLSTEQIEEINQDVSRRLGQDLVVANFNSPEQTVVSGSAAAVREAIPLYEQAGARRVVELPVSAPFHSPLMVPAADGLKPRLEALSFAPPRTPVISNLTVEPYPSDPAQYPLLLHAQIFNPVRWAETCEYLAAHGVTHLLEVGPGKVLRMLAVKTVRDMGACNVDQEPDRARLAEWLGSLGGSSVGEDA